VSQETTTAVFQTEMPDIELVARGKVRDIYNLGDRLVFVASDRLSAFDRVLPNPIPDKGKLLCQLSEFWFRRFESLVPNHVVTTNVEQFPEELRKYRSQLEGRTTIVKKLEMLPVECVARGYLAGSGYKEYLADGTVCGIELPKGLELSSKLPEPIFTPATKATDGHDENIPFSEAVRILGAGRAAQLRDLTLALYKAGSDYAATRGIIIADTKFEFGMDGDTVVLADEVLTPDSSRFWPADSYKAGRNQASFDKQFVRDYLESTGWDKEPPVPELPESIISGTRAKYLESYEILTGKPLAV